MEQTIQDGVKPRVVGVQYRPAGKIYTFITDMADLNRGEFVVVEAEHGTSIGIVILKPQEVAREELPTDIKKVVRQATKEDIEAYNLQSERELEILNMFSKKISEYSLPMKPLAVHLKEDDKKAILVFYAEERVDFRILVKDLAGALHMRIEMHQIGARDEVKHKGAIGPCGMVTCCWLHLRQFQPISIQMAKTQGLAPNPTKLTGPCNKLKCCLSYENSLYAELKQKFPKIGSMVDTSKGKGKIVQIKTLNECCVVKFEDGVESSVPLSEIKFQKAADEEAPNGEEKTE